MTCFTLCEEKGNIELQNRLLFYKGRGMINSKIFDKPGEFSVKMSIRYYLDRLSRLT